MTVAHVPGGRPERRRQGGLRMGDVAAVRYAFRMTVMA